MSEKIKLLGFLAFIALFMLLVSGIKHGLDTGWGNHPSEDLLDVWR